MPKNSPAKFRALRIPLRSSRRDRLASIRNWLTLAAIVICAGWLVSGLFSQRAHSNRFSPGPVSNVHAQLDCSSCHDSAAPLRDETFLSGWNNSDQSDGKLWHRPSDQLCQQCHPVPGENQTIATVSLQPPTDKILQTVPVAPHSPNQKTSAVNSCASCHSEHRGLDKLPSVVSDQSCIECHRSLKDSCISGTTQFANTITRFDGDHPDFRSLESDRGTLKFSHDLHLSVGLASPGQRADLIKTLEHYPDHDGRLAGFTDANGQIQLQCHFCHQPTDEPYIGNANKLSDIALADGKFMSLPSYESACQVCHPINAIPKSGLNFVSNLKIRHGSSVEKMMDDLKVYFALETIAPPEVKEQLTDVEVDLPAAPPTRLWDIRQSESQAPEKGIRSSLLEQAANQLRDTCLHCHLESSDDPGHGLPVVKTLSQPAAGSSAAMANVFEASWLKHARFDHAAHRDVNCQHCHKMDGGKNAVLDGGQDVATDRPMIESLQSCLECHKTGENVVPPARPGPTNCISCHTYHGGGNRH